MVTLPKRDMIKIFGDLEVPGDKSISHRAVILGSIAQGSTKVENFLDGEDCMRTVQAFREMGVSIEKFGNTLVIDGKGMHNLEEPIKPIYFGNSGTTARLMLGLFAGLPFSSLVYGDDSLTNRPMDRVLMPLKEMGAKFIGRKGSSYLPLAIKGGNLHGISYSMPVNSAQVKSAILLAGLNATGTTRVIENYPTRNHTEKMLQAFGANLNIRGNEITIDSSKPLVSTDIYVPGDISSAAFLITAAVIVPNSELIIRNIGLNKSRVGYLDVLKQMGAEIQVFNEKMISGEAIGDIKVTYTELKGITIEGEIIPRLIDEIPIIALLATQAEGKTMIRNAEELRVKETDRIEAVVDLLTKLGANIEPTEDGMVIEGKTPLKGTNVHTFYDHRIAMTAVVASLIADDHVIVDDLSSIAISYPSFMDDLNSIIVNE